MFIEHKIKLFFLSVWPLMCLLDPCFCGLLTCTSLLIHRFSFPFIPTLPYPTFSCLTFHLLSAASSLSLSPLCSPPASPLSLPSYNLNSHPVLHPVQDILAAVSLPGLLWIYNICSKAKSGPFYLLPMEFVDKPHALLYLVSLMLS